MEKIVLKKGFSYYLKQIGGKFEHIVCDSQLFLAFRPLFDGQVQVDLFSQYGGQAAAVLAVDIAAKR